MGAGSSVSDPKLKRYFLVRFLRLQHPRLGRSIFPGGGEIVPRGLPIDLNEVERSTRYSSFRRGLVLERGDSFPGMPPLYRNNLVVFPV